MALRKTDLPGSRTPPGRRAPVHGPTSKYAEGRKIISAYYVALRSIALPDGSPDTANVYAVQCLPGLTAARTKGYAARAASFLGWRLMWARAENELDPYWVSFRIKPN